MKPTKTKWSSRLLAFLMATVMTVGLLPNNVIPTVNADESWGNMTGGTVTIKPGTGAGSVDWNNNLNSMHGYKISVWYAALDPVETAKHPDEPSYYWGSEDRTKCFQVGGNAYFRDSDLATKSGQRVAPAMFGKGNIYELTTRNQTWSNTITSIRDTAFHYKYMDFYTKNPNPKMDYFNGVSKEVLGTSWSVLGSKNYAKTYARDYLGLDISKPDVLKTLAEDHPEWNKGQKALQDWINRIYDMNNPSNPNYTSGKKLVKSQDLTLPFAPATKAKDGVIASGEYIKSYFLNPNILNEIAFVTATTQDAPVWLVEDFITGRYLGKTGDRSANKFEYPQGQYKIFIEPCMFRPYNGVNGVMTWREMMSEYLEYIKSGSWGGESAVVNLGSAVPQIANALVLEKGDPVLQVNGKPIQSSKLMDGDWSAPQEVAKNEPTNGLGVGIITSPSLLSYDSGPRIIKTYVSIDSVDEAGNITYKQIADPVVINATNENFYTEKDLLALQNDSNIVVGQEGAIIDYPFTNKDDTITNVPKIEGTEFISNSEVVGTAVLNDIVSSIPDMNNDTTWVNELLPKDSEKQLQPIATEVKGSATGIVTESAVEVEGGVAFVNRLGEIVDSVAVSNEMAKFIEEMGIMAYNGTEVKGVTADVFNEKTDVRLGKVDYTHGKVVKITDEEALDPSVPADDLVVDSTDTLILRYIVFPEAIQTDVVEIYYEEDGKTEYRVVDPRPLDKDGTTVNIQIPEVELPEGADPMEIVEWVTNPEWPLYDISTGTLPPPTNEGKTGNTVDPIPEYPETPIIHNLYVKWRVVVPAPPKPGTIKDTVPEWRLSKYRPSLITENNPIRSASMNLNLTGDSTTHVTSTLSPSGSYNFDTINPNGQKTVAGYNPNNMNMKTITTQWLSAYAGVPANTFYHSKAIAKSSTSVSHDKPYADIKLDGNLNQIKSFDTGKINAASWMTDSTTKKGLEQHNIKTDVKPIGYSGGDEYDKSSVLKYGIYNKDTYTHKIANYRHKCGRWSCWCRCYLSTETRSPAEGAVTYRTADYNMTTTFERYVQKNTDNQKFTVAPEIKKDNGLTTIKYQLKDTLTIYPEVGMLFDNDADQESIKWVVGDQGRKISPVVYQTLQHKVWVEPTSVGTSVATDTRALQTAQKLGEANKQVIHKGAGVNNTFRLYRDDDKDSKAILTVKTFALDFKDKSALNQVDVKSAWGNGSYNSETQHDKLVNSIKGANKADATEKLLVDTAFGGNAEYVGGEKRQKTASYNIMSYNGKTTTVFEHELIVRGGYVIGVNLMSRTDGSKKLVKIEDLKKTDEALYNALVNMNLYNEKNDRNQTVFKTFEHLTGDTLTEAKYASDLANARKTVDKIDTPAYASVATNKPWYSEDTTVLVVKEYVTNFEIPSIAFGDKLSMSVADLTTPIQKEQFYSKMGKGYTYLKYDLPIASMYDGVDKTSCYFEFTSLPSDAFEFGQQKTDYLVPNVSITDTTRIN